MASSGFQRPLLKQLRKFTSKPSCEQKNGEHKHQNMDVEPKIGGFYPPKWMVYNENPIKIDGFGG